MTEATSSPSRGARPVLILGGLLAVAAIAAAVVILREQSTTDDPMTDDAPATATYANDTLTVAGIRLTNLAGYEPFNGQSIPAGWRARSSLVIQSRTEPIDAPTVAAAVFTDGQHVIDDPAQQLAFSEQEFGLDPTHPPDDTTKVVSETIAEGDHASSAYHCYYRVRRGRMNGPDGPEMMLGTIIAASPTSPAIGIAIDGGSGSNTKDLTLAVVDSLCP